MKYFVILLFFLIACNPSPDNHAVRPVQLDEMQDSTVHHPQSIVFDTVSHPFSILCTTLPGLKNVIEVNTGFEITDGLFMAIECLPPVESVTRLSKRHLLVNGKPGTTNQQVSEYTFIMLKAWMREKDKQAKTK